MKIIEKTENQYHQQMTVEETVLFFFRIRTTYRKIDGKIFRYKGDNKYKEANFFEYRHVGPLFSVPSTLILNNF